jgi:hypothetical protein
MKKLLFLSAAFAIALVACSKDKSEDLIEPMTKSGNVEMLSGGKQEKACTYYVEQKDGTFKGLSGKKCETGFSQCSYTNACGPL